MQDYKSLCAAVTICATLVKIQTELEILENVEKIFERVRKRSRKLENVRRFTESWGKFTEMARIGLCQGKYQ